MNLPYNEERHGAEFSLLFSGPQHRGIPMLQCQQSPLKRQATAISNQASVAADYAMAGHDYADRVGPAGIADGADRLFFAYRPCYL